jgi:hypothetical protein
MANIMSNGEIKRKTKNTTLSKQFQNPIAYVGDAREIDDLTFLIEKIIIKIYILFVRQSILISKITFTVIKMCEYSQIGSTS